MTFLEAVVEAVCEKWEKIDILVNNAGITRDMLMPRMSEEDLRLSRFLQTTVSIVTSP